MEAAEPERSARTPATASASASGSTVSERYSVSTDAAENAASIISSG